MHHSHCSHSCSVCEYSSHLEEVPVGPMNTAEEMNAVYKILMHCTAAKTMHLSTLKLEYNMSTHSATTATSPCHLWLEHHEHIHTFILLDERTLEVYITYART